LLVEVVIGFVVVPVLVVGDVAFGADGVAPADVFQLQQIPNSV
jgi:hypothetical protein